MRSTRRPALVLHRSGAGSHCTRGARAVVSPALVPPAKTGICFVNASTPTEITAEAYLARLAQRGVDYVFANAGTDFAPIVESLSRNAGSTRFPRFLTVPHENV